jgi:hypothetical protein
MESEVVLQVYFMKQASKITQNLKRDLIKKDIALA